MEERKERGRERERDFILDLVSFINPRILTEGKGTGAIFADCACLTRGFRPVYSLKD